MAVEALFLRFRDHADAAALGAVFDQLAPRLLSLALHLCPDPSDAEDALQATFLTAIERTEAYERGRPLLPWLAGILTMQCRRVHERRARRRERELADEPPDPAAPLPPAQAEQRELVATLRQHIDALPHEQRQALLLQLQHGLQPAEIAEVLAVPAGTVRVRLHRGLRALRRLLPAGFAAWLFGALPSRGLAAVRQAVMARAGVPAATALGFWSLILMKRLLWVGVIVLLGLTAWAAWPGSAPQDTRLRDALPGGPAAAIRIPAAAEPGTDARRLALADEATLQPEAVAELLVRVQRQGTREPLTLVAVQLTVDGLGSALATRTAVTGPDGTARFAEPGSGSGRLQADRGAEADVTWTAGETTAVTLAVERGATARGRVVDAQGAPVPYAWLWLDNELPPHGTFAVGRTDSFGEFTLQDLQQRAAIGASHGDFAPSWCVPVPADGTSMTLVLPAAGAAVTGCVLDPDGRPVDKALVEVGRLYGQRSYQAADGTRLRGSAPQSLATDASGRFTAAGLPAGEVELRVRARGFVPHTEHLATTAGGTIAVAVRLRPAAIVRGFVRDESGAPLGGAHVGCAGIGSHTRDWVRTRPDGAFLLTTADPSWISVSAQADGYAALAATRTAEPGETIDLDVTLRRLLALRIVLRDERGASLAGWQAAATRAMIRVATTDAGGHALLHEEDGKPLELWLALPGSDTFFPCDWVAELPTDREFELVVPDRALPAGWIQARVVNADGTAWSGYASVSREGRFAGIWSMQDGILRVGPLPEGACELRLAAEGGDVAPGQTVAVVSPGTTDLGEIRLPPTGRLRVRSARSDGAPLADAMLFLDPGRAGERNVPIDGEGNADVVLPAGTRRYKLWAENARWVTGTFTVDPGATARLDLRPEPGTRRGLYFPVPVPDGFGAPASVRYVLLDPAGEVYDEGDFDAQDELPFYVWPMLYPGIWQLGLTTDAGRHFAGSFAVDSLAASFEPIRIAVQPVR